MTYDEHMLAAARAYLLETLRHHNGNIAAAARAAGRNRTYFFKLLQKTGIDPGTERPGRAPREEACRRGWRLVNVVPSKTVRPGRSV